MRKRFIKWLIKLILPYHHLSKNGSGRRKKELTSTEKGLRVAEGLDNSIAEEMGHESPLDEAIQTATDLHGNEISADYRTSHLTGKFPGKNMGD